MKYYVVVWENKEKYFNTVREADDYAWNIANEDSCESNVFVEKDGIREEEPFIRCEWEI